MFARFARAALRAAASATTNGGGGAGLRVRGAGLLAAGVGAWAAAAAAPASCDRHSDGDMVLFSANANPELAAEIAALLGSALGSATVARFADGEVNVQVHDNVRGKDVYIIQPTSPPVNEHLMELLLLVSAARERARERGRESAGRLSRARS